MKVPLLPEFMHEQLQRQTVWRGGDRTERMSKEQTDTASAKNWRTAQGLALPNVKKGTKTKSIWNCRRNKRIGHTEQRGQTQTRTRSVRGLHSAPAGKAAQRPRLGPRGVCGEVKSDLHLILPSKILSRVFHCKPRNHKSSKGKWGYL